MEGDAHAFGELVQAYDHDLHKVCYVVTGDRRAAEDAAQATWEIAWRKLRQLRDPNKAHQWLLTVAVNEARRFTANRVERPDDGDRAALDTSRDLDLAHALGRLPTQDRQVLSLLFIAGMTSAEAGRVLGMSPEGVRTRKARILMRLRKELTDDHQET
jgi:RNA polymerase sigma factor (sigma-70 family)